MTRRSIIRVLLSLLLLMSQQMAFTHAVTHWGGRASPLAGQQETGDNSLSKVFAQHQTCDQCLSFAQIATALGNTPHHFAPADPGSDAIATSSRRAACARTVCVFQSRAPPAVI
jgi:hypothetical protein